jgi:hypothetical protein
MKKLILSFCFLVGVSYAATASNISSDLIKKEEDSKITAIELASTVKEVVNPDMANNVAIVCTVTLYTSIHAYGQDYQIKVTATADTCAHAGAAAGAKADDIQSHY